MLFYSALLCRVAFRRVFFCIMSLCWMSWRHDTQGKLPVVTLEDCHSTCWHLADWAASFCFIWKAKRGGDNSIFFQHLNFNFFVLFCIVLFYSALLCRVAFCRVFFCIMSLCWMSRRHDTQVKLRVVALEDCHSMCWHLVDWGSIIFFHLKSQAGER